ncbi:MAG: NAD(P)H-dependent oxidoreductase [Clostridia bacterium]|nr:NAD(P)H-dependent oxidoreductase [Clostridia bacterium]
MHILFADACVREESRTRRLALHLIKQLGGSVDHVRLADESIAPLDEKRLRERENALLRKDFGHCVLKYAVEFAAADVIVMAAPYWDLSFPAIMKTYIENICAAGVTFDYEDDGALRGLCRARRLVYVTTAGGRGLPDAFGFGYIDALCRSYFGINETKCICAEGLDITGANIDAILETAKADIDEYVKIFEAETAGEKK